MSAAGIFFLKGASLELGLQQGLIDTTQQAVGTKRAARRIILRENRRSTLGARYETLLFFPVIKHLRRPCHLVSYSSCELRALTGKGYAFATIDRHLREMTQCRLAHAIGDTLARCSYHAWYAPDQVAASPQHPLEPYVFYLDTHDKRVWSVKNLPRGMVKGQPAPCLRQVFLHGRGGHALYCKTYPGDMKLPQVAVAVITNFERAIGQRAVHVVVIDREGLSVELFQELGRCGAYIVTLLKSNQYAGVADFEDMTEARSLADERTGITTHRVAEGAFRCSDGLLIRCAVARDLDNGKLVVFATTVPSALEPDSLWIARWYLRRWNAQENSFRYLVAFVHLDTNFGLHHKRPVPNRVLARKRDRWEHAVATQRRKHASKHAKLSKLAAQIRRLEDREAVALAKLAGHRLQERGATRRQQQRARAHERLGRWVERRYDLQRQIETHAQKITVLERELAGLDASTPLYEIDSEKDQLMTHLKVALANSALYARQHYFGAKYHRALPQTLQRIFFSQEGYVEESACKIRVTLDAYRDPTLQLDAIEACHNFNQRHVINLDGKVIEMHVADPK
jgi:hypothetical protein